MGSIIGQEGGWASPYRDEVIHLDVCGAFGFGRGNGKHIRATAKAVREKEDVGTSSSRYRQRAKIVNTDGNARAVGQGDGEDGPANCLAGGLKGMMRQRPIHYFVQTSMPTHQ